MLVRKSSHSFIVSPSTHYRIILSYLFKQFLTSYFHVKNLQTFSIIHILINLRSISALPSFLHTCYHIENISLAESKENIATQVNGTQQKLFMIISIILSIQRNQCCAKNQYKCFGKFSLCCNLPQHLLRFVVWCQLKCRR